MPTKWKRPWIISYFFLLRRRVGSSGSFDGKYTKNVEVGVKLLQQRKERNGRHSLLAVSPNRRRWQQRRCYRQRRGGAIDFTSSYGE
jgi:hypothetical protein